MAAQRIRPILICLTISALLFTCGASYHTNCDDPINHWSAPSPVLGSIQQKYIQQNLPVTHAAYGLAVTISADTGQLLSYYRSGPPKRCADKWEPGSVMKPLTIAGALDTGSVNSNFTFYDSGEVTIDNQAIHNWTSFPRSQKNLETLLQDSLNVGAVAVVQQFKTKQVWYSYMRDHFYLDKAGQGSLPLPDDPDADYRFAVSSFGIGIVTTPLQMSLAYASLVNGGIYHNLCLTGSCIAPSTRVLKSSTSAQMKQLLTAIYLEPTTHIPADYIIGGKSGTAPLAQLTDEYYLDKDSGTYIGFIQHQDRTYIQLVRLDQPEGYAAASHAAREVWQQITDDAIAKKLL